MKRAARAAMARQTVAICDTGGYQSAGNQGVDIYEELARAKIGTVLYSPEHRPKPSASFTKRATAFEARNETAFAALARLAMAGSGHLACLNFASAKNAGGGFLNGAVAQEEALACASGLYPCLLKAPAYYARNRANRSALYLDLAIFSPLVPFFRDDAGNLLGKPILASVITAPAPNAGAVLRNEPAARHEIEPTLRRRAAQVLEIAQAHAVDQLVLGAWGCGVFQNDPRMVAQIFGDWLKPGGKFDGAFEKVAFAVFDRSESEATYRAFKEIFP